VVKEKDLNVLSSVVNELYSLFRKDGKMKYYPIKSLNLKASQRHGTAV
jgi:hypothetical protein